MEEWERQAVLDHRGMNSKNVDSERDGGKVESRVDLPKDIEVERHELSLGRLCAIVWALLDLTARPRVCANDVRILFDLTGGIWDALS